MKKTNINKIIEIAGLLNKNNKGWHYHLLGKDCMFNPNKDKFTIVLEVEGNNEVFFTESVEKPLADSKKLAGLMYGQRFLNIESEEIENRDFIKILERVEGLEKRQIEWHHHHLHPNCIFNEHKGKHCIVLEDPETKEILTAVYNNKPLNDLVKVERLFYNDIPKL